MPAAISCSITRPHNRCPITAALTPETGRAGYLQAVKCDRGIAVRGAVVDDHVDHLEQAFAGRMQRLDLVGIGKGSDTDRAYAVVAAGKGELDRRAVLAGDRPHHHHVTGAEITGLDRGTDGLEIARGLVGGRSVGQATGDPFLDVEPAGKALDGGQPAGAVDEIALDPVTDIGTEHRALMGESVADQVGGAVDGG